MAAGSFRVGSWKTAPTVGGLEKLIAMTERHVLTIGTFDMFHRGHYNLLQFCKDLGKTTVGVNSDEFVRDYKGAWPINSVKSRVWSVAPFGSVCIHDGNTERFVRDWYHRIPWNDLKFIVVGTDWARKDYYAQLQITPEFFDRMGINLVYRPYTQGVSSTLLRAEYEARKNESKAT